jgi:Family of unknown function (DUF5714)
VNCLVCHEPSESPWCPKCAELGYADVIRGYCRRATSVSPLDMAQEIMSHPRFPVAGQAHHPLVAAVLVTAWRNSIGADAAGRVEAAVEKADSIPGGFCAGFGADAAAIACGIAVSAIRGNAIKAEHAPGRALAHGLTGQAMLHIATGTGNRCCKRSVYGVLEVATAYFNAALGVALSPASARVECPFHEQNKLCNRDACRYFPARAAQPAATRSRLAVIEQEVA